MKKILLATRPIVEPWDEASKNFAYFLGKNLRHVAVTLMGTRRPVPHLPTSATLAPVFTEAHLTLTQKLRFFLYLFIKRSAFDVTHYLFTPTKQNTRLISSFLLPKGKTVQTVATLRDDLYTEEDLRSLLFADKIVTYTDRSKNKLEKIGINNVLRIYPGIDLALYSPKPKEKTFLESLRLLEEHIIVIYPGEYVRLGTTDFFVDFCISYFQKNPRTNVRFVFANRVKNEADAKKKEEVQRRLREAGVEDFVRYTDTVPDMPTLYNTADIIAFPVLNLNGKFDVPLVIIEAYACQKPVILSDLEAFQEFSGKDICATIPKGNLEVFEEIIEKLATQKELRETLGKEARLFVEKNFDLQNTVKEYEHLYDSL